MKVTAFLGSPRGGGNTDILASRVTDGARQAGLETETIALRKLRVNGCLGCERCWTNDKPCVLKDDMDALYGSIASTDILLIATPVYWYAPTAMMKAFMDRLVPFNRPQGRPLVHGKGAVLVTAYEEEGPGAAKPLIEMFELSFEYLNLEFLERIVVDGCGPKGAVMEKPDALDRAYEAGLRLAAWKGPSKDK